MRETMIKVRPFDFLDILSYEGIQKVNEHGTVKKGGILLFTYRCGRPEGQSTQMEYNEQFTGLSLGGTVSGTDKETVRVSLDIDGVEGSYPYLWAPPTGNIMYCMPKPGTKASLYFRSHDERDGQATNSPKSNGGHAVGCPIRASGH